MVVTAEKIKLVLDSFESNHIKLDVRTSKPITHLCIEQNFQGFTICAKNSDQGKMVFFQSLTDVTSLRAEVFGPLSGQETELKDHCER